MQGYELPTPYPYPSYPYPCHTLGTNHPLTELFPEPGIFATANEICHATYFATWMAIEPACIYCLYMPWSWSPLSQIKSGMMSLSVTKMHDVFLALSLKNLTLRSTRHYLWLQCLHCWTRKLRKYFGSSQNWTSALSYWHWIDMLTHQIMMRMLIKTLSWNALVLAHFLLQMSGREIVDWALVTGIRDYLACWYFRGWWGNGRGWSLHHFFYQIILLLQVIWKQMCCSWRML